MGETGPEDTEMHFMCLQFYKPVPVNGTLNVDLVFVVTYNLELFLEVYMHIFAKIIVVHFAIRILGSSIVATGRTDRTGY